MWTQARRHFIDQRRQRNVPQKDIAARGGFQQSAISKLESDPDYCPSARVFLGMVAGLGIPLADFFAQVDDAGQMSYLKKGYPRRHTLRQAAARQKSGGKAHGVGRSVPVHGGPSAVPADILAQLAALQATVAQLVAERSAATVPVPAAVPAAGQGQSRRRRQAGKHR